MNKKTFIQITVVVICLGASVLVVYNGLFKKDESQAPPIVPASGLGQVTEGASKTDPPLYGDNLAGELKRVLKRNGLVYGSLIYPKVDNSEIGISASDLIKSQPASKK